MNMSTMGFSAPHSTTASREPRNHAEAAGRTRRAGPNDPPRTPKPSRRPSGRRRGSPPVRRTTNDSSDHPHDEGHSDRPLDAFPAPRYILLATHDNGAPVERAFSRSGPGTGRNNRKERACSSTPSSPSLLPPPAPARPRRPSRPSTTSGTDTTDPEAERSRRTESGRGRRGPRPIRFWCASGGYPMPRDSQNRSGPRTTRTPSSSKPERR